MQYYDGDCMKKLRLVFASIICLFTLSSCYIFIPYEYEGEHPELLTEAINSLLWASGNIVDGEPIYDPYIEVIDEDDYGRILFKYSEDLSGEIYNLLILQATDNELIFYYEDINYLLYDCVTDDDKVQTFLLDNDWNQEINYEKCKSIIVNTNKDDDGPLCEGLFGSRCINNCIETFYEEATGAGYRTSLFSQEDIFGRSIYVAFGYKDIYVDGVFYGRSDRIEAVLLFNPDGTYDIATGYFILDESLQYNYKEALIELKANNGWNAEEMADD